jgi:hypothetical protein
VSDHKPISIRRAVASARAKAKRLSDAGFKLSRNDWRVVLYGQLLTSLTSPADTNASVANWGELLRGSSDETVLVSADLRQNY